MVNKVSWEKCLLFLTLLVSQLKHRLQTQEKKTTVPFWERNKHINKSHKWIMDENSACVGVCVCARLSVLLLSCTLTYANLTITCPWIPPVWLIPPALFLSKCWYHETVRGDSFCSELSLKLTFCSQQINNNRGVKSDKQKTSRLSSTSPRPAGSLSYVVFVTLTSKLSVDGRSSGFSAANVEWRIMRSYCTH